MVLTEEASYVREILREEKESPGGEKAESTDNKATSFFSHKTEARVSGPIAGVNG